MAQQEEGWPFGLRLLNSRIGVVRNDGESFSTLISDSHTPSTYSSLSDLDTQSTGSFYHSKSITLGSLIRISSFLELSRRLSRRSSKGRIMDSSKENKKNNHKMKPWLFSLCSKLSTDAVIGNDANSLGYYLENERRNASTYRRNQFSTNYNPPNGFSTIQD